MTLKEMSNPVLTPVPSQPVDLPQGTSGGTPFKINSDFVPAGDQPQAIIELTGGLK